MLFGKHASIPSVRRLIDGLTLPAREYMFSTLGLQQGGHSPAKAVFQRSERVLISM